MQGKHRINPQKAAFCVHKPQKIKPVVAIAAKQ
jgi:hypothetical protein